MPNMNVPARLEKIRSELSRVANHIGEYSGVSKGQALGIANTATEIATLGVQVAAFARNIASWRPGDHTPEGALENVLNEVRSSVEG